jgi:hypothetical protein
MTQNDGSGMDPGLAAALAAITGSGSSTPSGAMTTDQLNGLLSQTLFGVSGRKGITGQPLVGLMPKWIYSNPTLRSAVSSGTIDPYLVTDKPDTWRVYVGSGSIPLPYTPNKFTSDMTPGVNYTKPEDGHDKTAMVAQVKNQPYTWSADQVAGAIKKFQSAGLTGVVDFDSMAQAWGGLVERAGAMYSMSSGQTKVTPWDVLDLYKDERSKAGTSGSSGGSPSKVTQTSRSVAQITHGDGWSALQNTLSHMLGRDPSDEETRDFVGRMNHLASANPTISTSTTSGIGTAHQSTTSNTHGGFNSNDILENAYQDAQKNQDYAEYQSATTYYNSALSALGAIGG